MDTNTAVALASFVATAQSVVDEHYAKQFPNLTAPKLTADGGTRYVRIVSEREKGDRSVYCFVDTTNGDILKSASWRAPAKHARGTIFAADHGRSAVNPYGANYLSR